MSLFSKIVNGETGKSGATVGNESAGGTTNEILNEVKLANAAADVALGEIEGLTIENELAAIDEGVERIESALTQIADLSVGAGAKPALSSESMAILDTTLLKDIGVHATGLESSSSLGPVEATEEITLGLESKAGEAWDAAKKAYYRFLDWIVEQFNKLFGGYESLKSKAAALKKKEETFDGTLSKDRINVNLNLLIEGSDGVTLSTDIAKGITGLVAMASTKVQAVEDAAKTLVETCGEALDKPVANWTANGDTAPAVLTTIGGKTTLLNNAIGEMAGDYLGGRTATVNADNATKLEFKAPTKGPGSKEQPPLSRDKISAIADAVEDGAKELIAARKKIADVKKAKSEFEKISKASATLLDDSDFKDVKTIIRTNDKLIQNVSLIATGSIRVKALGFTMATMKEALSYADKSLKAA